jgi:hypothetical protein
MSEEGSNEISKQHHPVGDVLDIRSPEEQKKAAEEKQREADKQAEAEYKSRQLTIIRGNFWLTLALAFFTLIGAVAASIQGCIASDNADSARISAEAAKSAAETASDTLSEMQSGQTANDTHRLTENAERQTGASTLSARAAESAANTAKAALEAQSTPWLGIETDDADFIPPREFERDGSIGLRLTIWLRNYGSAPALDVSVYVPEKAEGGKYSRSEFFLNSNVCAEPEQAEREVQARELYGVEHIIWPSDHRSFQLNIKTSRSPASFFPGCISYRGHSGPFQHTLFFYGIYVTNDPVDPTLLTVPKVRQVTLIGLEPLEQRRQP